jgi:translocator protein
MSDFTAALIGGAIFCTILAVAGGALTKLTPWYHALRKPGWKPPDWSFGLIWTAVFGLLVFAIAYAWDAAGAGQRTVMLWALGINGALNIAWSAIFFTMKKPPLALAELVVFWLSIAALIYVLGGISPIAGLLLLPYIIWVTAAGVLNYQIVRLNPT